MCVFRINHSNNAIVKPPEMTPQAAAKELESVMKRVREAQSTIAAAIEPGMEPNDVLERRDSARFVRPVAEAVLPISVVPKRRSSSRSGRPRRSRSCSRSRLRKKRSHSKHRYADKRALFSNFSRLRGSPFQSCRAGWGPTPTVPDMATGGALTPETGDAVRAARGASNPSRRVEKKKKKTSRSYLSMRNARQHVIGRVILNQGRQEEEQQRSVQKPSKKSPIPLAEKVDAAAKAGSKRLQKNLPLSFFLPPPTNFASSRGKKEKKSERSRDKRDRSISRKRGHKEEDRIKGKTKSLKVALT